MNIEALAKNIEDVLLNAGAFLLAEGEKFSENKTEVKSLNQLVSYVDREAEQILCEGLRQIIPDAAFITEEQTIEQAKNEHSIWIIDPLDGTTNFIHGLPFYSISVALVHQEELIFGAVYLPNQNEYFQAIKGMGTTLNGMKINVSEKRELQNCLFATGFPYYDFDFMNQYLALLKILMKESRGLRRMGSAAIDLAYVACGRFDGFFEYGLSPWDVAAGALLVKEAGGVVYDFKLGNQFLFGKEILACSKNIEKSFGQLVNTSFIQ